MDTISEAPATIWRRLRSSPVTLALVGMNLAIYYLVQVIGGERLHDQIITRFCMSTAEVLGGEWWRTFTYAWLHSDMNHVTVNCKYLLIFGVLLEPVIGSQSTAVVYGLAIPVISLFEFALGGVPTVGASGAINALFGALLCVPVCRNRVAAIATWLVLASMLREDLSYLEAMHINHLGHIVGLVTGLVAGAVLGWKHERRTFLPGRKGIVAACAGALAIVIALSPDPRWLMSWHAGVAEVYRAVGDVRAAEQHWYRVEDWADPTRPVEAELLVRAARFHAEALDDDYGARSIYEKVAPNLLDASVYRELGILQGWVDPYDDQAAYQSLRRSWVFDNHSPRTLKYLAKLYMETEDSTLYQPRESLRLAIAAMKMDKGQSADILATRAWAHYECGDPDAAVAWLWHAVDLDPSMRRDAEREVDIILEATMRKGKLPRQSELSKEMSAVPRVELPPT